MCTNGKYSGILLNQPIGFGVLEVRALSGNTFKTVPDIGVGNVFAVAGQSNAIGMTASLRATSHPWASVLSLKAFPQEGIFRHAADPLNLPGNVYGSTWPIFLDSVVNETSAPAMLIMTAQDMTGLVSPNNWRVDGPFYNRLVNNISVGTGGTNCIGGVLYDQGE